MVIDYRLGVCEEEMPQDLCVEHVTDLSILVAASMIVTGVAACVLRTLYKKGHAKKDEANKVDLDAPVSELDKKMLQNSIIQARANAEYLLTLCGDNDDLIDRVDAMIETLDELDDQLTIILRTGQCVLTIGEYQEYFDKVDRVQQTVGNYIKIQKRLSNPGSIVSEPYQSVDNLADVSTRLKARIDLLAEKITYLESLGLDFSDYKNQLIKLVSQYQAFASWLPLLNDRNIEQFDTERLKEITDKVDKLEAILMDLTSIMIEKFYEGIDKLEYFKDLLFGDSKEVQDFNNALSGFTQELEREPINERNAEAKIAKLVELESMAANVPVRYLRQEAEIAAESDSQL